MNSELNTEEIYNLLKNSPIDTIHDKHGNIYTLDENIEKWRSAISKKRENYPVLEALEQSWNILESEYNCDVPDLVDRNNLGSDTSIATFMYMVDTGFYPPPEVMLSILDCLNFYEDMNGKVSLEEVFFGKTQKGVGNYAARKKRSKYMRFLHFWLQTDINNKSQWEIAEDVIDHFNLDDEPDSLLRQYRRFKQKHGL